MHTDSTRNEVMERALGAERYQALSERAEGGRTSAIRWPSINGERVIEAVIVIGVAILTIAAIGSLAGW